MHRTRVCLADYALKDSRVPDKIIFQFLDEAGGDKALVPTSSATDIEIDDQIPSRQRAVWMIHQGWRVQHRARLAQKAQEAAQAEAAKQVEKARGAAKYERDAEIAVEKATRAPEN